MYESLHVAIKMYINYSFFYIYISCFINAEVCNLYIVVGLLVILPMWKITWKRHYSYFKSKNCFTVILIDFNFLVPRKNNAFRAEGSIISNRCTFSKYEGRSISKLQNSVILLVFQI